MNSTPLLATGDRPTVPTIIADAGDHAVEQYRAFFDKVLRSPNTRQTYGSMIRRFLGWAGEHGLALDTITVADADQYVRESCPTVTGSGTAENSKSAFRSLFRHLAKTGVIATNPLETTYTRNLKSPSRGFPTPRIPLAELKRWVLEIGEQDGWKDGDVDMQAGLVLVAELSIRTRDAEAISRFTGVPQPLVQQFSERLIANEIWLADGKIAAEWNDPETGVMAFMLDVWVATGCLERQKAGEEVNAEETVIPTLHTAAQEESNEQ